MCFPPFFFGYHQKNKSPKVHFITVTCIHTKSSWDKKSLVKYKLTVLLPLNLNISSPHLPIPDVKDEPQWKPHWSYEGAMRGQEGETSKMMDYSLHLGLTWKTTSNNPPYTESQQLILNYIIYPHFTMPSALKDLCCIWKCFINFMCPLKANILIERLYFF